jgi:polysaccharide deacetylase family protein (PEP-CTERM system associated)
MVSDKETPFNVLSFDVEEWFQVGNFKPYIKTDDWKNKESRVEIGIDYILDVLDERDIKACFFMVGWVAQRHPEMIRKIDFCGHEIGIHGMMHQHITNQTPRQFQDDITTCIKVVSDIISKPIEGYRAPSYTVNRETIWALDILREAGILFDSSVYPISGHPVYGLPGAPTFPFRLDNGLYEFPIATFQILNKVLPFASGAYFRLVPYPVTRALMRTRNKRCEFVTINIHPWELDPNQEVQKVDRAARFKHYVNLSKNRAKFEQLAADFHFTTYRQLIDRHHFPVYKKQQDGSLVRS